MRRLMMCAAAVAALALPAAGAPAAATPAHPLGAAPAEFNSCGYYPTTTVHLRTGPGKRYTSLGLIGPKDAVNAEREQKGWFKVYLTDKSKSGLKSGTEGWVAKRHLKPAVCMQY
ncbi:SH3 domain-containing protein [Streptomyces sp. NPDC000229]|uniref:SH3 domain-containing protein n=1 Tax=Streptomyces sp. NPDC000229 TaxID=3154247 RepID=UPI00332374A6